MNPTDRNDLSPRQPGPRSRAESKATQRASERLRSILAELPTGANIPDSQKLREAFAALERFIPEVLREHYPEWSDESLDGFLPVTTVKVGEREAEVLGLCIITSDQTTTPIHFRLQISQDIDEISWMECKLGEAGPRGMVREKWGPEPALSKRLHALAIRANDIGWAYRATYGKKGDHA